MHPRVVVMVKDSALTAIKRVAQQLRKAGMEVEQILATTGIITGSAPEHLRPALARVAGVKGVEPDSDFPLPPGQGAP